MYLYLHLKTSTDHYLQSQLKKFREQVIRPRAIRGIFAGWNKTFRFRFKASGRNRKCS